MKELYSYNLPCWGSNDQIVANKTKEDGTEKKGTAEIVNTK